MPTDEHGDNDCNDDELDGVISRKSFLLQDKFAGLPYTKDINIRRVCDGNCERRSMATLVSTEFNKRHCVLLTASTDSTMAFFKVDGVENALLCDRVFEKYPLSSAKFTALGDKVIFTGNKGSFRIYNLETGSESRARRFIGSPPNQLLNKSAISDDHPNMVSLGSNDGVVYLTDLRSLEKIAVLRASGLINSMCFSVNGTFLNAIGDEGSVFVFDIRGGKSRVMHRWFDHASFQGLSIDCSLDKSHILACGSDSGYVNLYNLPDTLNTDRPTPIKSISNLVTACDLLRFNPSGELLCLASSKHLQAIRLYHMNADQVFKNFPVRCGQLDIPTSIAFSPGGQFLCVGQSNGRAAMYTISHYSNY